MTSHDALYFLFVLFVCVNILY